MEEVANRVNFDYEAKLFKLKFPEKILRRIEQNLEFIYFFIEKEPSLLFTRQNYDKSYLQGLKTLGCRVPEISKSSKSVRNWWGELQNLELESKLNSKLTSFEVLKELELLPEKVQVVDGNHKIEDGYILKSPYSFSGFGHYKANSSERKGKYLLEPYFKVIVNFGHRYDYSQDKLEHYISLCRHSGSFSGGVSLSEDQFEKFFSLFQVDLSKLNLNIRNIAEKYKSMGARGKLQIDSFIYEKDGAYGHYLGHDINYRRTMGGLTLSLKDYFEIDDYFWILSQNKIIDENARLISPPRPWKIYFYPISYHNLKVIPKVIGQENTFLMKMIQKLIS